MSPSPIVKFAAFVKLSMEKFAISNWKFNATKVSLGKMPNFSVI